jgi:hypothetical protein
MIPLMNLPRFIGCNIYTVTSMSLYGRNVKSKLTQFLLGRVFFHNLLLSWQQDCQLFLKNASNNACKMFLKSLKPFDKMLIKDSYQEKENEH